MSSQLRDLMMGAAVLAALATAASAETVSFGTLGDLSGPGDLDLTGNFVYAIDVGGPGGTLGGVTFNQDNNPYSPTETGANNGLGVGTWQSAWTQGYYPALNSPGNWGTSFSGDADLDAIMSFGRNDSGWDRISQFDVVEGKTYKVQILGKSAGTEDRTWDLAVGFGTDADKADSTAMNSWQAANLAVDNWQESAPKVWSQTLTATSDWLWIGASQANQYGAPAPADPNPILNAITVEEIPEPSTLTLVAMALIASLTCARCRRHA